MSRLNTVDPAAATGKASDLFEQVKRGLGVVPNMAKVMANSPAVLQAWWNFNGALATGKLSSKVRQQIAVLTAQDNGCGYCLSVHSFIGKNVGLSDDDLLNARQASATDPKMDAALKFGHKLLHKHGQISETDLAEVRAAGYSDGDIAEIIAGVALNVFTNYFNIAAQTDIDFPRVDLTLPVPNPQ